MHPDQSCVIDALDPPVGGGGQQCLPIPNRDGPPPLHLGGVLGRDAERPANCRGAVKGFENVGYGLHRERHDTIRVAQMQDVTYRTFCDARYMTEMHERLAKARRDAGYDTPTEAARARGWNEVTYRAHENGERGLRPDAATKYARAFKVSAGWLLTGELAMRGKDQVPIIGKVGASTEEAIIQSESDGELGTADMPPGGSHRTVALEVQGESQRGLAEDGWLIYYDDVRNPPTSDMFGELCVVGLADGRVLIKKLIPTNSLGVFHLESRSAPTLYDEIVEWAAIVTAIIPRPAARKLLRAEV